MPPAKLLTRAFLLAFVANLLHSWAFFAYLHLPGFLAERGADELMIGVVFGTMAASAIALRPAVGRLLDRRGRRVVARWGSVMHLAVTFAYLSVDSIGPWLFVVRIIHGAAEAMLFSTLFTIAADVVPASRRTEGIALFGVSGLLPMSLAGVMGDLILTHAGYAELFVASSIAAALGGLCSWLLADSRPAAQADAPAPRSFLAAVMLPSLRPLWLMGLSFALAIASYFTFLKTYVEHLGIGSMGLYYTVYSLAAIVLRLLLGWVPDRVGARRALAPAMTGTVIGLVVLSGMGSTLEMAVAGLLCGLGHAFVFPILSSLVVTRADQSERGAALSMFTALFDLGLLVGGPVLGVVLERTSYAVMFHTAAVVAALGGAVALLWDRRAVPGRG
ncbi:MFS transporter [Paraliomyxa miuraensis]|uniref:MFS transporter n=1 Tax=Paraliomyxa miuraensis TaxID=376150 RepID=UPI002253F154|nr:MFS transporter [Paraliomyxa miuraensis]MCX4243910.1 MFS transporter [Paraliomyxa miuraensis]